ncbi:MAG: cation:proton antiporter [Candidatus Omnitrophota bacterium]|jgi:Kef-type K+ transport system membrane component KefB
MNPVLVIGIIVVVGFIFGELAQKAGLPRVTGFILAGIFLNPDVMTFMPHAAAKAANLIINLALCFITFSIGGTLSLANLKKLGKGILWITILEAQFAFLFVTFGFLALIHLFLKGPGIGWFNTYIPFSILIGCIASPTDPTPALAITHEYNAKGDVTSTILGVSALDDAAGIMNFCIAMVIAATFAMHTNFSLYQSIAVPAGIIAGSVGFGIVFGLCLNAMSVFLDKKSDGALIAALLGILTLCFGVTESLKFDALLATMVMGIVAVNLNPIQQRIFSVLEQSTEELIFLMFFVVSGMQLNFSVIPTALVLIVFFVAFRILGKYAGTLCGAIAAGTSDNVKKYTPAGLIPYGGIVVGLGLLMKQEPAFAGFADIIIAVVIGGTILSEIIGSIFVKLSLKAAGEIS